MARKHDTRPPGLQALIDRVEALTTKELHHFLRDTAGIEKSDAEAWMRVELLVQAQDYYLQWAKQQMRLAAGLSVIADDPSIEDDDE